MLLNEDHEKILKLINEYGSVKIYDFTLVVRRTESYIDRHLNELKNAGLISIEEGPDGETTYCSLCIEGAM